MSAWHHDGEDTWRPETIAEAQRDAVASLAGWRDDADRDGEWLEGYADRVAWGFTVQEAVARETTGTVCASCGGRDGFHYEDEEFGACTGRHEPCVDYQLVDVPDLAETIAEVLSTRPAVTAALMPRLGGELGDLRGAVDRIRRIVGLPEGATTQEIAAAVERLAVDSLVERGGAS